MATNELQYAVGESIRYLASEEAMASLYIDPYWPKWHSPWWHMLTLYEMGLTRLIPEALMRKMIAAINAHYIRTFPFVESDIPKGVDAHLHIPCHCALGSMFQIISAYGYDPDRELSWVRPWFLKYQLPDGGLNCDESAYVGSKKSSIVSTLPPLEAVLFHTRRPYTPEECAFLDNGARYLIEHRLIRSRSSGQIIDKEWLNLCFPRFYHYDLLRGLSFLVGWAERRSQPLPKEIVAEGLTLLAMDYPDGTVFPKRTPAAGAKSRIFKNEKWEIGPASSFPLLDAVSRIGDSSPYLTSELAQVRRASASLR